MEKGDLIGVLIPRECTDEVDDDVSLCPSQVNLPATNEECPSAFFHPMDNIGMLEDNIDAGEFMAVPVDLNMEVTIAASTAGNV